MKKEIKQQIFEKMKATNFGESMCNKTKLNVLKWTLQQLRKHDVISQVGYSKNSNKKIPCCDGYGCCECA